MDSGLGTLMVVAVGGAVRRYLTLGAVGVLAVVTAVMIGLGPSHRPGGPVATSAPGSTAASATTQTSGSVSDRVGWPPGTVVVSPAFEGPVVVYSPEAAPLQVSVGEQVAAVAVAPTNTPVAGAVYAITVTGALFEIAPAGTAVKLAQVGGVPSSMVVATASAPDAGSLYVLDGSAPVVTIVSPQGQVVRTVGVADNPVAVGFALGQAVVLSRGSGAPGSSGSLVRITSGGVLGPYPTGSNSVGLLVAGDGSTAPGTAYVTNAGDGTVTVVSPSGKIRTITGFEQPTGVIGAADPGSADVGYVVDGDTVKVIGDTGGITSTIQLRGPPTRPCVAPAGTPDAGLLYAGIPSIGAVVAIDPAAHTSRLLPTATLPVQCAVAPVIAANAGEIYVVDRAENQVIHLDSAGKLVTRASLGAPADGIAMTGLTGG